MRSKSYKIEHMMFCTFFLYIKYMQPKGIINVLLFLTYNAITISEIKNHPWFNLVETSLPDNAGTIVGIDL